MRPLGDATWLSFASCGGADRGGSCSSWVYGALCCDCLGDTKSMPPGDPALKRLLIDSPIAPLLSIDTTEPGPPPPTPPPPAAPPLSSPPPFSPHPVPLHKALASGVLASTVVATDNGEKERGLVGVAWLPDDGFVLGGGMNLGPASALNAWLCASDACSFRRHSTASRIASSTLPSSIDRFAIALSSSSAMCVACSTAMSDASLFGAQVLLLVSAPDPAAECWPMSSFSLASHTPRVGGCLPATAPDTVALSDGPSDTANESMSTLAETGAATEVTIRPIMLVEPSRDFASAACTCSRLCRSASLLSLSVSSNLSSLAYFICAERKNRA